MIFVRRRGGRLKQVKNSFFTTVCRSSAAAIGLPEVCICVFRCVLSKFFYCSDYISDMNLNFRLKKMIINVDKLIKCNTWLGCTDFTKSWVARNTTKMLTITSLHSAKTLAVAMETKSIKISIRLHSIKMLKSLRFLQWEHLQGAAYELQNIQKTWLLCLKLWSLRHCSCRLITLTYCQVFALRISHLSSVLLLNITSTSTAKNSVCFC